MADRYRVIIDPQGDSSTGSPSVRVTDPSIRDDDNLARSVACESGLSFPPPEGETVSSARPDAARTTVIASSPVCEYADSVLDGMGFRRTGPWSRVTRGDYIAWCERR